MYMVNNYQKQLNLHAPENPIFNVFTIHLFSSSDSKSQKDKGLTYCELYIMPKSLHPVLL